MGDVLLFARMRPPQPRPHRRGFSYAFSPRNSGVCGRIAQTLRLLAGNIHPYRRGLGYETRNFWKRCASCARSGWSCRRRRYAGGSAGLQGSVRSRLIQLDRLLHRRFRWRHVGQRRYRHQFALGFPANHVHTDPSGLVAGGQIGCDYQNPSNWLIGLQGEFNWTNAHGHQTIFHPLHTYPRHWM